MTQATLTPFKPGGCQWAQKVKPSGLASFQATNRTLKVISQKSLLKLGWRGISGLHFSYNQNFCTISMEVWNLKFGDFAYSGNPAWLYLGGQWSPVVNHQMVTAVGNFEFPKPSTHLLHQTQTSTGLSKKVSARLCELATMLGVSLRNLAHIFWTTL